MFTDWRTSRAIENYVKEQIKKNQETKKVYYESSFLNCGGALNTTDFVNQTILITPNTTNIAISQGAAADERTGNTIKTQYCRLKLQVKPAPYNAMANSIPTPQYIGVYIWKIKNTRRDLTQAQAIAANSGGSFWDNNGSYVGFQDDTTNFLKTPNSDQITLLKSKTYKLGNAAYETNTGTQANSMSYTNNDFNLCIMDSFDITKYYPKTINFNDTGTNAACDPLYMTIIPMDFDGFTHADTTSAVPALFAYSIDFRYKDA